MARIDVEKAETTNRKAVVRPPTNSEKGQPRIVTSSRFIQDTKKTELAMPRRLCVFDDMMLDDAVFNSVDVTNLLVVMALANGKFKAGPSNSSLSKAVSDFMNYNIRNMSYGTWLEAMNNASTDLTYGFSLQNIVTEKRMTGKYKGFRVLKKLSPRDQKSVYGWVWDKHCRELQGFVQKPNLVKNRNTKLGSFNSGLDVLSLTSDNRANYPYLKSSQLLHFRHNPINNNPQGDSPLLHCYDSWLEKKLVEKYEVVGVSKDLGGALVLRVPSELIERANDPANYPDEATEYAALQKDAGDLHAGESAYIVLSSDVDPTSKVPDYDIQFKGIDGGGKQYKTSDIIRQKKESIYNLFGAGFLLLGQDGSGSYALSSSLNSTHGFYAQRNIMWKTDVINNQLTPTLLAVNGIHLNWDDMPVFESADPEEFDVDVMSKAIQRMKSVGGITEEALRYLYTKAGWPTEGIENLVFDDGDTSRAGESEGSSGTGNTQSEGASSAVNSENGGVEKNFVIDGDRIIDTSNGKTINEEDL